MFSTTIGPTQHQWERAYQHQEDVGDQRPKQVGCFRAANGYRIRQINSYELLEGEEATHTEPPNNVKAVSHRPCRVPNRSLDGFLTTPVEHARIPSNRTKPVATRTMLKSGRQN